MNLEVKRKQTSVIQFPTLSSELKIVAEILFVTRFRIWGDVE